MCLKRPVYRGFSGEGKCEDKFLPSHLHSLTFRLKRPVYRGFSGEGKCEGKLSPLTLALTPQSVLNPLYPAKAPISYP